MNYIIPGPRKLILLIFLVLFGIFFFIFYPTIIEEVNYVFTYYQGNLIVKRRVAPKSSEFGIFIPKIYANAVIVSGIDPFDEDAARAALKGGIAHARWSSLPDLAGNVFLFSHIDSGTFDANRTNTVFFLINKLEKGEEIDIYYKKELYKYIVIDKKVLSASDVDYLSEPKSGKTVTIMTGWPAGTTFKRLLVIGELLEN